MQGAAPSFGACEESRLLHARNPGLIGAAQNSRGVLVRGECAIRREAQAMPRFGGDERDAKLTRTCSRCSKSKI